METDNKIPQNNPEQPIQELNQQNNLKQKGYLLPIIGVIILILVVGAGAYFLNTKKISVSTPSAKPIASSKSSYFIQNKKSEWLTQKETTYGFQVDVPPGWYVHGIGDQVYPSSGLTMANYDINDQSNYTIDSKEGPKNKVSNPLVFDVHISTTNTKSIDEIRSEWLKNDGNAEVETLDRGIAKTEDIMIDSKKAVKFSYKENKIQTIFVVGSNNWEYTISPSGDLSNPKNVNIFNQILSTLKFTDQNQNIDTSNWKSFQGNHVVFTYPPSWNPKSRDLFGGAVSDNISLGIPNQLDTDQDLGFSSVVDFMKAKPGDVVTESSFTISGNKGVKWIRKGQGYISYDYASSGFDNNNSFNIHVTLPQEDKNLENQLDQIAQSVKFN